MPRLKKIDLAVFISMLVCWESSASAISMYVHVPSSSSQSFTAQVSDIARRHGLRADVGQATDDTGHTIYVVEAKNFTIKVQSQNLPLSDDEARACGILGQEFDPKQFILSVTARFSVLSMKAGILKLAYELKTGLTNAGFDVRDSPLPCKTAE